MGVITSILVTVQGRSYNSTSLPFQKSCAGVFHYNHGTIFNALFCEIRVPEGSVYFKIGVVTPKERLHS